MERWGSWLLSMIRLFIVIRKKKRERRIIMESIAVAILCLIKRLKWLRLVGLVLRKRVLWFSRSFRIGITISTLSIETPREIGTSSHPHSWLISMLPAMRPQSETCSIHQLSRIAASIWTMANRHLDRTFTLLNNSKQKNWESQLNLTEILHTLNKSWTKWPFLNSTSATSTRHFLRPSARPRPCI